MNDLDPAVAEPTDVALVAALRRQAPAPRQPSAEFFQHLQARLARPAASDAVKPAPSRRQRPLPFMLAVAASALLACASQFGTPSPKAAPASLSAQDQAALHAMLQQAVDGEAMLASAQVLLGEDLYRRELDHLGRDLDAVGRFLLRVMPQTAAAEY